MIDKYNINFTPKVYEADKKRLINQLWKLVPMKENGEDWETHLNTIKEEIIGLVKVHNDITEGLVLVSKLEGLTSEECSDFMIYRKIVFKCIDLLSRMMSDE